MTQPDHLAYWKAKNPNYWRRAWWHDYSGIGTYMITMLKNPAVPSFGRVDAPEGRAEKARVYLSQTGLLVNNVIHNYQLTRPWLRIYRRIVMPDHVHFVIYIKESGHNLGQCVSEIKGECTRAIGATAFLPGYHDRISTSYAQAKTMCRYVSDNPRRLYLKMHNPQYFSVRHRLTIGGIEYEAIGNPHLLESPFIQAVRISSAYAPELTEKLRKRWHFNAKRGGVLVSPFISPKEKEVRDYALETRGNIILLEENGFTDRYKPSGPYMDACAEGRVLIIAPLSYHTEKPASLRQRALQLNALAAEIAGVGNFV